MMPVSVLIPSYNHAPFVERTLRSIFRQTLQPRKLIVIDDGSKDESIEIIRRVLKECPFPNKLITRENRGLCATLNEGFNRLDGEFFAYLGSDDVWLPEFLEKQIALLNERPNASLAFGHAFWIDEADNILASTDEWTDFADGDLLPMLLRGEIFSSPTVVYRRAKLPPQPWNENARLEDYELYLKLAATGEFACNPQILSGWRRHGTNASGDLPTMFNEMIEAQNRLIKDLKISRAELNRIQREMKFAAAFNFVRHGKRREAFELFRKNLGGAKSAANIAKLLVRLVIPQKLFQQNRRRKELKSIERYGRLEY